MSFIQLNDKAICKRFQLLSLLLCIFLSLSLAGSRATAAPLVIQPTKNKTAQMRKITCHCIIVCVVLFFCVSLDMFHRQAHTLHLYKRRGRRKKLRSQLVQQFIHILWDLYEIHQLVQGFFSSFFYLLVDVSLRLSFVVVVVVACQLLFAFFIQLNFLHFLYQLLRLRVFIVNRLAHCQFTICRFTIRQVISTRNV